MKKEESVLNLFFERPTKQWHFEEILKEARISRPQASRWLKAFTEQGIAKRVKPKGKMPYYIGEYENPSYQTKKKLFALNQMEANGMLTHLASLKKAESVILFGSMSRWDWTKESDIDLFIYGDPEGFDKGAFRKKTHRQIELFTCKNKQEIKSMNPALMRSITEGYIIKGNLQFLEAKHAK